MEADLGLGRAVNVGNAFRSRIVSWLFNPRRHAARRRWAEWRRRLTGRPHKLLVFVELDDPYSYLLCEYLGELVTNYAIELQVLLVQSLGEPYRAHPELQAVYAEKDCRQVAAELGIPFLDRGNAPPVEHRRALIDALAANEQSNTHGEEVVEAIRFYWRGDTEGVARRLGGASTSGQGDALLQRNQAQLEALGHYSAAMIFYGDEWYWGIDRLPHLADRLDALGLRQNEASGTRLSSLRQLTDIRLPVTPPGAARELPPLELFCSFRSPYTYLALQRIYDIADAFGLSLQLRPVLPMVMRGIKLPRAKALYIASDTSREAARMKVPFGRFADPLGGGIERLLAVCCYAISEKREREFFLQAARATWAEGIDVKTDRGLRKVTGRSGLFWPDVLAALEDRSWQGTVAANREALMATGCWGVPTLRLGDYVVWGQDRLWLLVRHIEDACESGDGILV